MTARRNKYGAKPQVVDGVRFASKGALRNRAYRERKRVAEGKPRSAASPYWTFEERLAHHSIRVGECLLWTGANVEGYAWMRWRNKGCRVSRLVLEEKIGRPLLPGMFACHTCDAPSCIEADHLFEGTAADNRADMDRKGRARPVRGEDVGTAKLTATQILEIRTAAGTLKAIAEIYGVSLSQISRIKRGEVWSHV